MPKQTNLDADTVERRAYRINDFCTAFGLSRSTVYGLIAGGRLQSVLIAGRRLIPADAAEALLRNQIVRG